MLSLREKLKAAGQTPKQPDKPRPEDCLIKAFSVPGERFLLPEEIGGDSLSLMLGGEWRDIRREDICFLDTETTGLSHGAGTVAFLVGVGCFDEKGFTVRQYLIRDYDEEIFLLKHVSDEMNKRKVLCTFNGATFDLPLLEARFTMHRLRDQMPVKPHVDLLPASRRVWKLRLQKCSLTALEEAVLGLERVDDLPGALVPERYFSFLKTKDFALLKDVLDHNGQDIVSLAHILDRLIRLHDQPLAYARAPEDLFSIGRVYEKRGNGEKARMCYRAADRGTVSVLARGRMAESYRKAGEWDQAAQTLEQMVKDRQGGVGPLIALAKIQEHKKRDIPAAIEYTRRAILLSANSENADMQALQRRYARLMQKARRQ